MSPVTFVCWLLLVWVLGWLSLPLTSRLWSVARPGVDFLLPDAGLAAGRVLLLCLWTLAAFWVGQVRVPVRYSALLIYGIAAILVWLWWRERAPLKVLVQSRRRGIIASEAIFFAAFLFFFGLRGFWSGFDNGEKPMDLALIAACARADYLPPPNPYAAGERLGSYYYLGHLQTALLTDAIGAQPRWTYNLMAATLPGLCFSVLASLAGALTGRVRYGALVAFVILGCGTEEAWRQWTQRWFKAREGGEAFAWWPINYWDTSRVIPYVDKEGPHYAISEYPWFSFNYGDLHAHYFAQPLALLLLSLALALFHQVREGAAAKRWKVTALVAALISGAQIMTNTWDFPTYFLLLSFCLGSLVFWPGWNRLQAAGDDRLQASRAMLQRVLIVEGLIILLWFTGALSLIMDALGKWPSTAGKIAALISLLGTAVLTGFIVGVPVGEKTSRGKAKTADERLETASHKRVHFLRLFSAIGIVACGAILSIIVALPFLLRLHSAANPPRPLEQPGSPLNEWLLVWGVFAGAWLVSLVNENRRQRQQLDKGVRALQLVVGAISLFLVFYLPLARVGIPCAVLSLLLFLAAWTLISSLNSDDETHVFLCRVALCGLLALLWSETTWAGFLDKPNHRQDTIFKFGLQAWYLLGLASACGFVRLFARWAERRPLTLPFAWSAIAILFFAPLVATVSTTLARSRSRVVSRGELLTLRQAQYPVGAIRPVVLNGLIFGIYSERWDGWDAWAQLSPAEQRAAQTIQDAARDGENLLEAEQKEGGDYTEFTRYAHATGVPSVIGPQAHTFQWGLDWDKVFGRKADVRRFYLSGQQDSSPRDDVMQKYKVRFVLLGELERREYGEENMAWLERALIHHNLTLTPFAEGESDVHRVTLFSTN